MDFILQLRRYIGHFPILTVDVGTSLMEERRAS